MKNVQTGRPIVLTVTKYTVSYAHLARLGCIAEMCNHVKCRWCDF